MNTPTKLGAYVLGLAVLFAGAAWAGDTVGPAPAESTATGTGGHGTADTTGGRHAALDVGGLQVSQDGYTLAPRTATVPPGKRTDFTFTITGRDGRPVTRFTTNHGKPLHLIVARRDLSGFQHLHPVMNEEGVWSTPLTLPEPGAYRLFADIQPEEAGRQLTLGVDVTAPGDYHPHDLPRPSRISRVDDYEVRLAGDLIPGRSNKLTLTVSKDGTPVTDLEPYLGAYGHLVALRNGDLAYLHVHPDGEPGDGTTRPGPQIPFHVEVPSAGAYRLYLDFQHEGTVRTAEFTAVTSGSTAVAPSQESADEDDGHGH